MDRVDYTFKFSTELVVLGLSLIVVVVNAAGHNALQTITSNSAFAKELSYRPNLNKSLYNKDTAVTTVVTAGGIIPQASARIVLASADQSFVDPNNAPQAPDSIITDNAIVRPSTDNVRDLVANQIKTYTVQSGDNLAALSKKFNISVNTIAWANNLSASSVLKPGMTLTILPVDGVFHKVGTNDTLPDIAKAFNADINQIISYNGLADDQDIYPGDLLIIPGGTVPGQTQAKPSTPAAPSVKHVVKGKTVYEPVLKLTPNAGHIFPWGQCTYYVAFRRDAMGKSVSWGGNASAWLRNAQASGADTGTTPMAGSIVVTNENRRYGHVALVEQVTDDSILVSEMNYKGRGIIDQRSIPIDSKVIKGYIY